jgi:hypothetical protein
MIVPIRGFVVENRELANVRYHRSPRDGGWTIECLEDSL